MTTDTADVLLLSRDIQYPEVPPRPPWDHRHLLGRRSDFWRRVAKVLWLVSSGFSLGREIRELVAADEDANPRSGAMGRLLRRLTDTGMLTSAVIPLVGRYRMSLFALGPASESIIARLRWQPVESEWERMRRLHEKGKDETLHTLATIAFAYHARVRGYRAGVVPGVNAKRFTPDAVVVGAGGAATYVEVERSYGADLLAKWRHMAEYQGRVALCARTRQHREHLAEEAAWGLPYPGTATDLETLFRGTVRGADPGPLWLQTWNSSIPTNSLDKSKTSA